MILLFILKVAAGVFLLMFSIIVGVFALENKNIFAGVACCVSIFGFVTLLDDIRSDQKEFSIYRVSGVIKTKHDPVPSPEWGHNEN